MRSGARAALASVSLEIPSGSFTCIVGASGCGKSTLLNMIGGLDTPSAGRIEVAGSVVEGPGPERGMVFQSYALYPWLRVRQNVEFGLRMTKRPKSTWKQVSEGLLEEMGLSDFADAYPRELSGGMRQRVAIARALATDPPVMLMDEPFGALDALTRIGAQRLLLDIWQRHQRTIVFVTHDINEALLLGDQLVVLSSSPGRVKELIPVGFSRPRTAEITGTAEFTQLRERVLSMIFDTSPQSARRPDVRSASA
jgi:NitT/TauT family transport system ATP-binding protein